MNITNTEIDQDIYQVPSINYVDGQGGGGISKISMFIYKGRGGFDVKSTQIIYTVLHQNEDFDIVLSQIEMSCKCLQNSTWGEGGSKSPKNCLRSLWTAPRQMIWQFIFAFIEDFSNFEPQVVLLYSQHFERFKCMTF